MPIVLKSESLKLLEHSGPVKGRSGIAFTDYGVWSILMDGSVGVDSITLSSYCQD